MIEGLGLRVLCLGFWRLWGVGLRAEGLCLRSYVAGLRFIGLRWVYRILLQGP